MATNTSRELRLILKALNELGGPIKDAVRDVEGFSDAVDDSNRAVEAGKDFAAGFGINIDALSNPAMAAGQALRFLVDQAWELGQLGAQNELIRQSFEGLAESAGSSADEMLEAFDASTGGMLDQVSVMKAFNDAAQLVGPQFARTLPDAMQYLGKISASTGQDIDFLMNSLVTGVGRLSPMILDNLKITVDATQAYEDWAQVNDRTVDSMSKQEQQLALNAQVLELLAQNTASLPEVTDSSAASFARLETATTDLKNEFARGLAPAVADVAEGLATLVSGYTGLKEVNSALNKAVKDGTITWLDAKLQIQKATWTSYEAADAMEWLEEKTQEVSNTSSALIEGYTGNVIPATENVTKTMFELGDEVGFTENAYWDYIDAQKEVIASTEGVSEATRGVDEAMKSYSKQLLFNELSQNMTAEAALYLGQRMGLVDENTIKLLETIPELTKTYDLNEDGVIDLNEAMLGAAQAAIELDSTLSKFDGKVYRAKVITTFLENRVGNIGATEQGIIPGTTADLLNPVGYTSLVKLGRNC
jgi:hypothetical protein